MASGSGKESFQRRDAEYAEPAQRKDFGWKEVTPSVVFARVPNRLIPGELRRFDGGRSVKRVRNGLKTRGIDGNERDRRGKPRILGLREISACFAQEAATH